MPGEIQKQYIGARYVPKLADPIEWTPQRSYEQFEMVLVTPTTYPPGSYISRKPVPRGILITDTDYWAFMGSKTTAIEYLSNQLKTLTATETNHYKELSQYRQQYEWIEPDTVWIISASPGYQEFATQISTALLNFCNTWNINSTAVATFTGTTRFSDVITPIQNLGDRPYRVIILSGSGETHDPLAFIIPQISKIMENIENIKAIYAIPMELNKFTHDFDIYMHNLMDGASIVNVTSIGMWANLRKDVNVFTAAYLAQWIVTGKDTYQFNISLRPQTNVNAIGLYRTNGTTEIQINIRGAYTLNPGGYTDLSLGDELNPILDVGSVRLGSSFAIINATIQAEQDPTKNRIGYINLPVICYLAQSTSVRLLIHTDQAYYLGSNPASITNITSQNIHFLNTLPY